MFCPPVPLSHCGYTFEQAQVDSWDSWDGWDGWDSWDQQINRQLEAQSW